MSKIVDYRECSPQHVYTAMRNANQTNTVDILTIYTGDLYVGHGSEDNRSSLEINFPLLGLFDEAGTATAGIYRISSEDFRGAAAMVAFTDNVTKDDDAVWQARDATADLRKLTLNPNESTTAVVLNFFVESKNSEIGRMSYQVSVLTHHASIDAAKTHLGNKVLVGSNIWDGTYKNLSNNVLISGAPMKDII